MVVPGRVLLLTGIAMIVCCAATAPHAFAQTLPARVRTELYNAGYEEYAGRLVDAMEARSTPDRDDVEELLERWERADGGPSDHWDWLTVARLWLRAGDAELAENALDRAGGALPEGILALDRARIGFLAGNTASAAADYWRFCAAADELSALEAWRDIEVLATPEEIEEWDRFRRLPAGQRDDCSFFRRFWNERSARSGMPVDERVALHYERLRFAMDHYVRRGTAQDVGPSGELNARLGREGPPKFDDRGLLYLRLGPPDKTARTIGGDCYQPNVSWYYRFPDEDRLYHLSPLGGNDNWWMLSNLAEIFRCSVDAAGRVSWDRNPMVAVSAPLTAIPPHFMYNIYISRAQLDPRYARIARQLDRSLHILKSLRDERELTWADGRYAIAEIPERPDVRMDIDFVHEWLAFRRPLPDETRVWLVLMVSGEDLAELDLPPADDADDLEVVVTVLSDDGRRQERVTGKISVPAPEDDALVRIPLSLAPGPYEARVVVRSGLPRTPGDDRDPPHGGYTVSPLAVPEFGGTVPRLSDVAVSPDSGGAWAQAPAVGLSPAPVHVTNADGRMWIYFEAYNLTPGGAYSAVVRLEPEDGGSPFELEFTGVAEDAGRIITPAGLRLDLADSAPGRYRLSLTVRDMATGRVTLPEQTEIRIR